LEVTSVAGFLIQTAPDAPEHSELSCLVLQFLNRDLIVRNMSLLIHARGGSTLTPFDRDHRHTAGSLSLIAIDLWRSVLAGPALDAAIRYRRLQLDADAIA
jgi:hypothetical protein